MSEYKEFQGKSLDMAIADACSYYDAPREKLEIEIVEDAKSGIFGLVGARKATIKARRALLPDISAQRQLAVQETTPEAPDARGEGKAAPKGRQGRGRGKKADAASEAAETDKSSVDTADAPHAGHMSDAPDERNTLHASDAPHVSDAPDAANAPSPANARGRGRQATSRDQASRDQAAQERRAPAANPARPPKPARPAKSTQDDGADTEDTGQPRVALADLDQDKLRQVSADMVTALVRPIVGDVPLDVHIGDDRVQVRIDCEDTGLLIGREGQNLAAVQYLAARMIARAMGAQVRVQVDAGDYHSRQDSRLRDLALELAEKMRATGKAQSTKPLSAYQRRVVHLTLQDIPDIQTRSAGDGAFKRVIIQRKKEGA